MHDKSNFSSIDARIASNHRYLMSLLTCAERAIAAENSEQALNAITKAAEWAWHNGSGILCSKKMESLCARLSAQIMPPPPDDIETEISGKRAIILSSIHAAGGHSRLAERWIIQDTAHEYVLVLTRQGQNPIPESLEKLRKIGRLHILLLDKAPASPMARISKLRLVAAKAKAIVLLIHPDDPLPSVAFSNLSNQPPTLFVDHAGHCFSLGIETSHAVVILLTANAKICHERRGIPLNRLCYIPLPIGEERIKLENRPTKNSIRSDLKIPSNAIVLLSSGWPYKFRPIPGTVSLYNLIEPIILERANVHVIVIGPTESEQCWSSLLNKCQGKVHLLGPCEESRMNDFFDASDIYLESAPFSSGMAVLDAILAGLPVIKFTTQEMRDCGFSLDAEVIPNNHYIFTNELNYRQKLLDLIDQPKARQQLASMMKNLVIDGNGPTNFINFIAAALKQAENENTCIFTNTENNSFQITALDRLVIQLNKNIANLPENTPLDKNNSIPVRALAFYLPQFHTIPENDKWWGDGFTEWDNVRQGKPLFDGHYQPHEPAGLGYYNLNSISILENQAALARQYGLEGFCFYHYWFDGKRLLEKPVDQLLQHPEIDLPFCLCWANENWTRRWDGGESEILMKQSYSKDNNRQFAADLVQYFSDPRYIRVNEKPLFLIYRTDIIPELFSTVAAWRDAWHELGVGEVYLVCVESFTARPPSEGGFNASCEFFPHQIDPLKMVPDTISKNNYDIDARINDYAKLAKIVESRHSPHHIRFRGLIPSWDNAARRRKGGATLFINSGPDRYEKWLEYTVRKTVIERDGDERLIFINAWNEWGEGCHLEPDLRYGTAWLDATLRALQTSQHVDIYYHRSIEPYQQWFNLKYPKTPNRKKEKTQQFKIIVNATHTPIEQLSLTLKNFANQEYENIQLIVVSTLPVPKNTSNSIFWLQSNAFPNILLQEFAYTSPEGWFCLIQAGDQLNSIGVSQLASYLTQNKHISLVYGDEDTLDPQYGYSAPKFHPDFNLDYLHSYPYLGRFIFFRGQEYLDLGGINWATSAACFYDYTLRHYERFGESSIGHCPEILIHATPTQDEENTQLQYAHVLCAHFERSKQSAIIDAGLLPGSFKITYTHQIQPLVSIIIPNKNQLGILRRCLESLLGKTTYRNFEIILIDNQSTDIDTINYIEGLANLNLPNLRVLSYAHPFNFADMNNLAANEARGEYLVLLNNDTAIIQPDWLTALLNHALRPEVGIVGSKLLYPNNTVQHAGVILGLRGPADHPFIGEAMDAPGYLGRLLVDQQYSAVTAACMIIRKSIYETVGGMDAEAFAVSYNDVDLCLKVRNAGYKIIWTPYSVVMHEGSVSQNKVDIASQDQKTKRFKSEQYAMYKKWLPTLISDPAYNKNLSLAGSGFEIETAEILTFSNNLKLPKILVHNSDFFGQGHYRLIQPFQAMVDAGLATGGYQTNTFDPIHIAKLDPNIIVLQRQISDEQLRFINEYKEFSNAKIIYDLDDLISNLPTSNPHKIDLPKDVLKKLRRATSLCDRVIVSTEALKIAYKNLHHDIVVLPNYLPLNWWQNIPQEQKTESQSKPRVGWAGGGSHAGDLRLIADVVKALADRVDWVFFGMCPKGTESHIAEFHPGIAIDDYPRRLASLNLDLALAPLEINQFNECKSNLRLLEYGVCGYPVIASDIEPYRCGLPVILVKNRYKDWIAAIEEKLIDRQALRAEGISLQAAVRKKWMLEGNNLSHWYDGWTSNYIVRGR